MKKYFVSKRKKHLLANAALSIEKLFTFSSLRSYVLLSSRTIEVIGEVGFLLKNRLHDFVTSVPQWVADRRNGQNRLSVLGVACSSLVPRGNRLVVGIAC